MQDLYHQQYVGHEITATAGSGLRSGVLCGQLGAKTDHRLHPTASLLGGVAGSRRI